MNQILNLCLQYWSYQDFFFPALMSASFIFYNPTGHQILGNTWQNICFILSFITIRVTPVNYNIHICPHYWTIYWTITQCAMNINLVIIISLFICWLSGVTILWQKTSVMVDVCSFRNKRWRNNSCCLSRLDCLNVELQRWCYCTSVPAEVGDDTIVLCFLYLKHIA